MQVIAILAMALGLGFVVSAFASYALSRQLGLVQPHVPTMRDMTLSELERLGAERSPTAEDTFQMDEDAFRLFYERTARPVWAYLSRMSGDARLADDLLQETYYRFLRADVTHESDAHRRNYLFRIATNLVQRPAPPAARSTQRR